MFNFIKKDKMLGVACTALLSLSMFTGSVFATSNDKITYLDSVTDEFMYPGSYTDTASILRDDLDQSDSFEATFRLDTSSSITNSTAKVNLSLRDADVRQVLRMLANKAKLNVLFSEKVEGKVTMDLKDISVNDALITVLNSCKYTYKLDGNTLSVMDYNAAKDAHDIKSYMTFIPVKYLKCGDVADYLNELLFNGSVYGLSAKPVISTNPRTNQLIIMGTMQDVNTIKRILPLIDSKPIITSFTVNHTTPKEMADLICKTFVRGKEDSGSSASSTSTDSDTISLGAGVFACATSPKSSKNESSASGTGTSLVALDYPEFQVLYFNDLGKIEIQGGSPEKLKLIKEFIKDHDKKQLMAYIELSVIELNESGSKEFTNEWNLWTPFISIGFNPGSGLSTSSLNPFFIWGDNYPTEVVKKTWNSESQQYDESTTTQTITKSNNKALTYKLQYLIETGNGRVLTNPKIMVTNGQKSTIDMTSDYVKSVTSEVLQSSSSITSATQRKYNIGDDEGLKIEIVPFISPDGYLSMNITPEFATIKQQIYATNSSGQNELQATLLQRRDLELKNIRIKDGETLVLAGLIKETETQSNTKMPLLSDLPFIGAFFRENSNSKTREELVILVTPHLVKDSTQTSNENIYDL